MIHMQMSLHTHRMRMRMESLLFLQLIVKYINLLMLFSENKKASAFACFSLFNIVF